MQKYNWKKNENTEQGEPGSSERLLMEAFTWAYVRTVWAIIDNGKVGTHTKNIKNTTLKTQKKAREIYFLNGCLLTNVETYW